MLYLRLNIILFVYDNGLLVWNVYYILRMWKCVCMCLCLSRDFKFFFVYRFGQNLSVTSGKRCTIKTFTQYQQIYFVLYCVCTFFSFAVTILYNTNKVFLGFYHLLWKKEDICLEILRTMLFIKDLQTPRSNKATKNKLIIKRLIFFFRCKYMDKKNRKRNPFFAINE